MQMRKIDFNAVHELIALGAIDCTPEDVIKLHILESCLKKNTKKLKENNQCCTDGESLPKPDQLKECWAAYESVVKETFIDSRYYDRFLTALNEEFEFVNLGKSLVIASAHELLHLVNKEHKISDLSSEEKNQLHTLNSRKEAFDGACCATRADWGRQLLELYGKLLDGLNEESLLVVNLKKAAGVETLYFYHDNQHLKTL